VIEGSIPNQHIIEGDGYRTPFGNDRDTGEALTLNWWIDHLAEGVGRGRRGHVRYPRWDPHDGRQSDGVHGGWSTMWWMAKLTPHDAAGRHPNHAIETDSRSVHSDYGRHGRPVAPG
jgi:hypothetical protein